MADARLEHFLRNTVRTYRVTLADVTSTAGASTGTMLFEVLGAANKKVKLRHLQIFKPNVTVAPFRLAQYSVASTGSSSQSAISPTRISGSGGTTYGGIVRFYTGGQPAGGTLLNQGIIVEQDLSTGDVVNEHFGDERGYSCPTLSGATESFAGLVTSTASVVLNGYIEFTEEP